MRKLLYFISIILFFVANINAANSDLGALSVMNYGESGQPPHALTSITGSSGVIPSFEQSITYTDFKKVSQITEDDNVLNITYGVGDQRIKSVLTNAGGTLTRYYAGNYEEENRDGLTRKIHYINGGAGLAALYVQNNGSDTLYYAHTDYQGSVLALSLPNGTVKERYAYDPWGRRRDPSNWSLPDPRKSFISHRGYTMHEHLPEFNLINMNGRVYDPLTAQFLGLDPHIQSPGNWLNYNRYAYAFNNPLIYSDPDGESIVAAIIIGAVIGAYTGGTIANDGQYNPTKWDYGSGKTWGYMLAGAAVGGVSGWAGASIAASGIPFANTASIASSSLINSVGTHLYTGGETPISVSVGFASYDFTNNKLGFLGKKGNKWYDNVGYGLGSLANLRDVTQLMGSIESSLHTSKDSWHSHNGLVDTNDPNRMISFGPEKLENTKDNLKAATLTKSTMQYSVSDRDLVINGLKINKYMYSGFGKLGGWAPPYNVFTLNCSNFASAAMWVSGIPNIGFYPYLTHATTWFSVNARPDLWSYHFLYK